MGRRVQCTRPRNANGEMAGCGTDNVPAAAWNCKQGRRSKDRSGVSGAREDTAAPKRVDSVIPKRAVHESGLPSGPTVTYWTNVQYHPPGPAYWTLVR